MAKTKLEITKEDLMMMKLSDDLNKLFGVAVTHFVKTKGNRPKKAVNLGLVEVRDIDLAYSFTRKWQYTLQVGEDMIYAVILTKVGPRDKEIYLTFDRRKFVGEENTERRVDFTTHYFTPGYKTIDVANAIIERDDLEKWMI
jgi:hypothetical protein